MFEKIYVRKWTRRDWVLLSICAVIALAGIAVGCITDPTGGTASIVGRLGTPAHPYADASQCPLNTDLVIWREGSRSIPNIPAEFSVCFVGNSNDKTFGPLTARRGQNSRSALLVARAAWALHSLI